MSARSRAWSGALMDIGLTLFQLLHLCLIGFFVDAAGGGETLRIGAAIYLPIIHGAIVLYLLWDAYIKIGKKGAAAKNPETLLGIWCEVINVVMFFGVLYNFSRVVFLPSGNPIHTTSFLDNLLISVYESSMVQAGIGFVSTSPTTAAERIVTFLTAQVGGVLFVNIFLLNVIFSRRYWASLPEEKEPLVVPSAPPPVQAAIENWKLNSLVAARA